MQRYVNLQKITQSSIVDSDLDPSAFSEEGAASYALALVNSVEVVVI